MTAAAKSAEIDQVALATAFSDGKDVVRIPEALANPRLQAPMLKQG
ncbi:hypothetical protein ACPOL_3814 [Acidisarcina polymorpha]|uniref:Uncharacterized protein n=1 Tax=Acidisarcina polymorpha TaxID=2211140 RepID=A0A2Z5G1N6_9BACT|nr:hypothetical protein ACPOL_3814 [Acidisarcina polymorpha]